MEKYVVKSNAGKFYIGDICYKMKSDVYDHVWGDNDFQDGKFEDKESGAEFAIHGTCYGDGGYPSSSGKVYGVDSGVLGVVPKELWGDENEDGNLGSYIEASEITMEVDENYTFFFYVDGKCVEEIYTGDEEDEEDEEEVYDNISW